jgi:hypothetical protein
VIHFRSIKGAKDITVRGSRLSCKSDMPRGERRGRSVLTTYCDLTKKGLLASTHDPLGQILISDKEHRVFPLSIRGAKVSRSVGHRALPETMPRGGRRGRSVLTTLRKSNKKRLVGLHLRSCMACTNLGRAVAQFCCKKGKKKTTVREVMKL